MRVQLGKALIAATFGVGMFSGTAGAQSADWATCSTSMPACNSSTGVTGCCSETAANLNFGSGTNGTGSTVSTDTALIIPMDRCHQPFDTPSTQGPPLSTTGPKWCADAPAGEPNGMMHAYGLVYRLMQVGVPVYWLVNPTKHASGPMAIGAIGDQVYYEDDIDLWILHSTTTVPTGTLPLNACTAPNCPVSLLADNLTVASTVAYKEFALRGSVFLIAGTDTDGDSVLDRTEFNNFWNSYGDGSPASGKTCASSNDCYNFTQVRMYEVKNGAVPRWTNWSSSSQIDGLPVAVKLNYKPPRIARAASNGNVSNLFLREANLEDEADATKCGTGVFTRASGSLAYDPVVCTIDEAQVINNSLVNGNFGWAWLDSGPNFTNCARVLQALQIFMTGVPGIVTPGNVMVNDTRLTDVETCVNNQLLGRQGIAYASSAGALNVQNSINEAKDQPWFVGYPTNLFAQYGDLPQSFASGSVGHWTTGATWGYNTYYTGASNTLKRLLVREATTSPMCGDNNGDGDLASSSGTPDSGDTPHYADTFPHATDSCFTVADNQDTATYGRWFNNPINGITFYLPGNNMSNNGTRAELRMLLNSLIATPQPNYTPPTPTQIEASRSSPIVPIVNSTEYVVQGTYLTTSPLGSPPVVNGNTDIATWYFPYRVGHLRMKEAGTATVQFDAGCNMQLSSRWTGFTSCATTPSPNAGIPQASRVIFTNTAGGDLRAASDSCTDNSGSCVAFSTSMSNKSLLGTGATLSTATIDTMIGRVIKGYPDGLGGYFAALGGIDRSTAAVIQKSDVAVGGTNRPTMIYVGAADGMMHAICAEQLTWLDSTGASKTCNQGRELWAFLPRKMLPFIRLNAARIDGSPRVLDAYIDPDGTGPSGAKWRTVMIFQTGMGDFTAVGREPAVYAMDITDPANPALLWEFNEDSVTAPVASRLGQGLTVSAGQASIGGATKWMVWVQTNNLGTSGPGTVLTSLYLDTGGKKTQSYIQSTPNPRDSTNHDPLAISAIPGGTVPVDLPSGTSGKTTHIMFNDVWGRTWLVDPDTLISVNGASTPLFRQDSTTTGDYYAMGPKPSILESGGSQYAVFGTGGYSDPSNSTWPYACCASANGTSCDSPQPTNRKVCALYNNSTAKLPTQQLIAVKIDKNATTSVVAPSADCDRLTSDGTLPDCASTSLLLKRSLGRDMRANSQALIVGTDIFFNADNDNVNRADYGNTGASTGTMYRVTTATASSATTAVVLGSGGVAAGNAYVSGAKTVYGGSGTSIATTTTTSTGNNVSSKTSTGVSRKVWLRTE